jgi:serine/tyrosine/threonine adenylyltransferase
MTSLATLPSQTPTDTSPPIAFDNSYARLPETFYQRVKPTRVDAPTLLHVNDVLARQLGIDPGFLKSPAGVDILSGRRTSLP